MQQKEKHLINFSSRISDITLGTEQLRYGSHAGPNGQGKLFLFHSMPGHAKGVLSDTCYTCPVCINVACFVPHSCPASRGHVVHGLQHTTCNISMVPPTKLLHTRSPRDTCHPCGAQVCSVFSHTPFTLRRGDCDICTKCKSIICIIDIPSIAKKSEKSQGQALRPMLCVVDRGRKEGG